MEVDCKNAQIIEMSDLALTVTFKYNSMAYNALLLLRSALKNDYCRNRTSKPRKPRTTGYKSQNHHFNGHIQQICVETGIDKYRDFWYTKMQCKYDAIPRGYPFFTMRDGSVIPKSESDSSTEECALLIETAHQLAAELNIELKESDE